MEFNVYIFLVLLRCYTCQSDSIYFYQFTVRHPVVCLSCHWWQVFFEGTREKYSTHILGLNPTVLSTFGRASVPQRLINQSLYQEFIVLQKFNDIAQRFHGCWLEFESYIIELWVGELHNINFLTNKIDFNGHFVLSRDETHT